LVITVDGRVDLAALKREHPLSQVLAAIGVSLHPAGGERFTALCPFHDDHRPSLLVDERDGHFHCFGCGAHDDVIDFVMRRDGVVFVEACRHLGAIPARSTHQPGARKSGRSRGGWDRLTLDQQVVMNVAGAIYQQCLWREPRALGYARERGLPEWVIRQCALGYADGHTLESYLRRRSCLRVPQTLGLLRYEGSPAVRSEFLAGRLVIPELRAGQFVWFIGRRLEDDGPDPKYLALPGERPILGYERAAGRREAFLCEGVVDYLVAVAWRLPAFSPCGTAVPDEQLGFLASARTVYGVLDGDTAGRAAADRLGAQLGERWCPLPLPEGRDLGDLARRPDGRSLFFALLASARQQRQRLENVDGS
jgi:DNA primase